MNAIVPIGANALIPTDMDQAIRLAKAMASAKLVPKHLQDDVGSCLMIVEQAMRWGMSPFAVAQCTSSISSKLMFEGKLVAAAVESCGAIEGGFDYEFKGEGEDRTITVSARRRGETNPRHITIALRDVRTTNEWWKKQPDQMLVYSGVRNWARRWTPAAILGVYSPEEFGKDGKPVENFNGPTIDAEPEPAAESKDREAINREVPIPPVDSTPKPQKMTVRAWLDEVETQCAAATTEADANAIIDRAQALDEWLQARPAAYARWTTVRDGMLQRIYAAPPDEEEEVAVDDDPFAEADATAERPA